jgi:hypothetical protein
MRVHSDGIPYVIGCNSDLFPLDSVDKVPTIRKQLQAMRQQDKRPTNHLEVLYRLVNKSGALDCTQQFWRYHRSRRFIGNYYLQWPWAAPWTLDSHWPLAIGPLGCFRIANRKSQIAISTNIDRDVDIATSNSLAQSQFSRLVRWSFTVLSCAWPLACAVAVNLFFCDNAKVSNPGPEYQTDRTRIHGGYCARTRESENRDRELYQRVDQ